MGTILFIGMTLTVLGKLMAIVAGLLLHSRIMHERKIDERVLHEYHIERLIVILGLILIVVGYIMELYSLGFILP